MATIFCTQLKIKSCHSHLDGRAHTDAIMNRIIYNSIAINVRDINMREVTTHMNNK